jgi:uncharacterized DUF497 family protein
MVRRVDTIAFPAFEWDPNKRLRNLQKSGIDFPDAALALLEPHLETPSSRGGERRTKAICKSFGRIIVVIFTIRDDTCRIISSWPADKNEQREFRSVYGG